MNAIFYHPYYKLFVLLALLSTLLSGCGIDPAVPNLTVQEVAPALGYVETTTIATTAYLVEQALNGQVGSSIWVKGDYLMFVNFIKGTDAWVFWGINLKTLAGADTGSLVNPQTMKDLTTFMAAEGWAAITATQASELLVNVAMTTLTTTSPTVIILVTPYTIKPGQDWWDLFYEQCGGEYSIQ